MEKRCITTSRMKWCSTLAIAVMLLGGCGEGSGSPAPTPSPTVTPTPSPTPTPTPTPTPAPTSTGSVERNIAPNLTNSALTTSLSPHIAITPVAGPTRGRLFVMLPGTGTTPSPYRLIVRQGAQRGFHTIGLTYPNDEAVAEACILNNDPACSGNVRREIITGTESSALVSVTAANSITGRLTSLLSYLVTNFPNEGWGQYLVSGRPNWSMISVGGHSQGAGHAAYLAKLEVLDRVVMFAGPAERLTPSGLPATWLSQANLTPVSRQYGFIHTADPLVPLALVTTNWAQIGLSSLGAQVSVDGNTAPFGNSRQLLTSLAPNPAAPSVSAAHSSVVVDVFTPLDAGGLPVYRAVWDFMAFP